MFVGSVEVRLLKCKASGVYSGGGCCDGECDSSVVGDGVVGGSLVKGIV